MKAGFNSGGYRRLNFAALPPNQQKIVRMMTKGSYVYEHRLVAAEAIGRPLTKHQFVHHKDGVRSNNILSNLVIMSRGQHACLTRLERWLRKPVTCFTEDGTPYQAHMTVEFVYEVSQ